MRSLSISLLIVPLIAATIWGLVAWLIKKGRSEYKAVAETLGAISALSIPEAERRALTQLADTRVFRCIEALAPPSAALEPLASGLKRLFSRYERIETILGPATILDGSLVAPSHGHPGFLVVGVGMEGSDVQFQIGTQAGEEAVYELHIGEPPDPTYGTYRSVYHWLVAVSTEARSRA